MNSKELVEQAEIRVKRINELSDSVGAAEDVLAMISEGEVCFFTSGIGTTHLTPVLSPEKMQKLREAVVTEIILARNKKTAELEQLLGIRKPATINPEFDAATKDMFDAVKKTDPVEDKLTEILQAEADRIEKPTEKFEVSSITAEDKSLEKYPAKKRKRAEYPEGMTVENVRKMYIDQGMKINDLAIHFKVPYAKMSNFITRNHLHRVNYQKSDKPDKQPEETERP